METITFNQLRKLKDSLPNGSMQKMANILNVPIETVRNYFGGENFRTGSSVGIHFEQGPDGGLITFDDPTLLHLAKKILAEEV